MGTVDPLTPVNTVSREEFWRCHTDQWRASELSRMAYCQRHSLIYHQMLYWSRKFLAAGAPAPSDSKQPLTAFVPVAVTNQPGSVSLSLALPNGIEIRGITSDTVHSIGDLLAQL